MTDASLPVPPSPPAPSVSPVLPRTLTGTELVSQGVLQEVNRRLLHRRGLALRAHLDDNGDLTKLDVICADDDEGFAFADGVMTPEKLAAFESLVLPNRAKHLGYDVQPAPGLRGPAQQDPWTSLDNLRREAEEMLAQVQRGLREDSEIDIAGNGYNSSEAKGPISFFVRRIREESAKAGMPPLYPLSQCSTCYAFFPRGGACKEHPDDQPNPTGYRARDDD